MNSRKEFETLNDTGDEYGNFDLVLNKTSQRADLHAFNLLDKLVPKKQDIVASADHDIIYLSIEMDELDAVATPEDILTLYRCGIGYDTSFDCLYSFV